MDFKGAPQWKKRPTHVTPENWHSIRLIENDDQVCVISNGGAQNFFHSGKRNWHLKFELWDYGRIPSFDFSEGGAGVELFDFRPYFARFPDGVPVEITQAFCHRFQGNFVNGSFEYRPYILTAFEHSFNENGTIAHFTNGQWIDAETGRNNKPNMHQYWFRPSSDRLDPVSKSTFSKPRGPLTSPDFLSLSGIQISHGCFNYREKLVVLSGSGNTEKYTLMGSESVDGLVVLNSKNGRSVLVLNIDRSDFGKNREPLPDGISQWPTETVPMFHWLFENDTRIVSALIHQRLLYLVDIHGEFICLDPFNETVVYRKRLLSEDHVSTPVASREKIYLTSRDGQVVVVKAGPEFELDSRLDLSEETIASPVLSNGHLFVSTTRALYAFTAAD